MIPLRQVSILRLTYLVPVVLIQLTLVDNPGVTVAQLNLPVQMNITAPPPQIPSPNFNVGRTTQPPANYAKHRRHTIRRYETQRGPVNQ
jgi:hypothetical protein